MSPPDHGAAGDTDDPLARLVQEPGPTPRPSEALTEWARAQAEAERRAARRDEPPALAPAAPAPPPTAAAEPAAPPSAAAGTDRAFAVLSLDAVQGAAPPASEAPASAPAAVAATEVAIVAPPPVPAPAAATATAAAPAAVPAGAGLFDHATDTDDPDEIDEPDELGADGEVPAGPGRGGDGSTRLGPFWRWGFPAMIVVLALLVPVLVNVGQDILLRSTDGRLLNQVTDPKAPGYQVITEPTPTLLLVQTDDTGVANGLTVMSLTGEDAGGLIFIPMTTVLELAGIGNIPLDAAAARAGLDGLQKAVEGVLGVGMAEVAVVDPKGWADLVAPLGTLEVANPDDVKVAGPGGEKTILFPKGTITLTPADVPVYLETLSPGENDLNRLVRHQAFWEAWLRRVGTSDDPAVVPGESSSGLGRFVRELAAHRVDTSPLPVKSASIPGSDLAVYLPVAEQVTSLVARLVPFPIGAPPGARPRVRLLDGTGTLDLGVDAVANVVAAGGQVDQIGNADAFDAAVTTFQYSDDARLPEVERLRAGIGVGEIVKISSDLPAIDVTIILGADFAAQPPPSLAPVTTAVR